MKSKIMYMERKGDDSSAEARVGRMSIASFSRIISYKGKSYRPFIDRETNANYYDDVSGGWYWFSHCQKEGIDSLDPRTVTIDDDVKKEYWEKIRRIPDQSQVESYHSPGKRSR